MVNPGSDRTSQHASQQDPFAAKQFSALLTRIMEVSGAKSDSDLGRILGITPQSVSGARKRKQVPPAWVTTISFQFDVSSDWLLYGTGASKRGVAAESSAPEYSPQTKIEPPPTAEDFKMADMLTKTAEVLESDTIYRTALASNINAFHQAVRSERTLVILEERLQKLERGLDELKQENRQLRQRLDNTSGLSKAVGEDG